jgi:radical SAM superfamily enzyme YgiQ (UPF0313 family)
MKNRTTILLSSVFGPYGVDSEYSRKENLMELYHNQVTREQGLFSLRCHHHSFGLYFMAENIDADTTVLDFPSQKKFIKEIKKGFDYVGISFIASNFSKAKRMAELVRKYAPSSRIVLGGHGTRIEGIEETIPHDFTERTLGIPLKTEAAVLIPGVGCPNACRFCSTSHFFDKEYTSYFDTGKELFDACVNMETHLGAREFFVMDENFLKRPKRVQELLQLMETHDKLYRFGIFSSADTIDAAGAELLVRFGVYFVWIGVESKKDLFEKNEGIDIKHLVKRLRDHGIGVLASSILFLEHHDKESIWEDIRFAVDLEPDFSQFMQLGPFPVTTLYKDYKEKGTLRRDIPYEEWHGQHRIWFDHPHFTPEESEDYLRRAFRYEYDTLGPGMLRMCDTVIRGFITLAEYDHPFIKKRRRRLREIARRYYPVLPVLRKHAHNLQAQKKVDAVTEKYRRVLGPLPTVQRFITSAAKLFAAREVRRIKKGLTVHQPKTIKTRCKGQSLNESLNETLKEVTV